MSTTSTAPPITGANNGDVNQNAVRKWTWTVLRLVILAFLITGVVDVIIVAGRSLLITLERHKWSALSDPINTKLRTPVDREYSPYKYLGTSPEIETKTITYKRLHIDIDPNGVTASYDIYLPKDHPLFQIVETDYGPSFLQQLVHEVLGSVSVSEQKLKSERVQSAFASTDPNANVPSVSVSEEKLQFDRVETTIDVTDPDAHIYVSSAHFQPNTNRYWINVHAKQLPLPLNIASKEVIVHTRNVNVHSGWSLMPISKTETDITYILPPDEDDIYFVVEVKEPEVVSDEGNTRRTLGSILQTSISIPGFDRVLYGLLASLPFLMFLYWNKRSGYGASSTESQHRVNAVKTYLVFHFSYFFFYAISNLITEGRSPYRWVLSFLESRTLYVFGEGYHDVYIMFPMMAMFICVWPSFAPLSTSDDSPTLARVRATGAKIVSLMLFLALFGLVVVSVGSQLEKLRTNLGSLAVSDFYLMFFGVALLVLYLLCLLLAYVAKRPARLQFAFGLFSILLLLIASDIFYAYAYNKTGVVKHLNAAISWVLFGVSALFIVRSFLSIFYQAITGRPLRPYWATLSSKKRLLLNLAMLAIALSTRSWSWPMVYWPLWSLVWELKDLFLLALAWILAAFLYRVSEDSQTDWLSLPESARDAGILLAISLFFSPVTRWYYIPVSFIAGAVLLRLWLLPRKQFDRSLFSEVKAGMGRRIGRVIAFNDAERALRTLKKELLVKLGKGEIEPEKYSERVEAQVETVKALRKELTIHKRFAKDLVLAFGPGNSAWENGTKTAYYSLFFSIPWAFLYLRNIVRAPATSESYLLLDLVNNASFFALAWLSYGFIFGYFYPHIRGNNGIQKGLALLLTIVVPEVVWTALAAPLDNDNWLSLSFWILQVFVHTMLLGLVAGDLAIMRANGFRWGHLLEFHRMASLSAWASTVILAVAAAVSTLISSGATQVLTQAFKFIGVIPQDVNLPTK